MSAAMVLGSNGAVVLKRTPLVERTDGPRNGTTVSEGLGLARAHSEEVFDAFTPAGLLADADDRRRLARRFEDLTWQSLVPVMALVLTFVVGVFAGAQFLVSLA